MKRIGVTIVGAQGRMGRELICCIRETDDLDLTGLVVEPGSPMVGTAASFAPRLHYVDDIGQALRHADVIVDFSAPTALEPLLESATEKCIPLVSGTTGFGPAQRKVLHAASRSIPLFYSPNMSVGIHAMVKLVELASTTLGSAYDIEVIESHHRCKKDAPSGTALRLLSAIQSARSEKALQAEDGSGEVRHPGIPTHSIRGGDVVGDHTVYFMGLGDRLEITHRATSRRTFALGALRAARWLVDQSPGLYGMDDLLSE